jgi:hypothetical protein
MQAELKCTLSHKKEWKDNEAKYLPQYLVQIKSVCGIDYAIEVLPSTEVLVVELLRVGNYLKDRAGETIFGEYMKYLAEMFVKHCKGDMVREAIVEATKNRKIIFIIMPSRNPPIAFREGCLYVSVFPNEFAVNVYQLPQFDVASIL